MTEFDLEKMLARSQLWLSVMFIVGYFSLVVATAAKWLDASILKDVTPFVGIIIYYWFQRQRPHSAVDGTNGNGDTPHVPTTPVNPASQSEKPK
jgi:hypothetical protein